MKKIRILIIRMSSIGDILLSTAFIRQVRIQFPNAKIDFLIKKEFYDLVRYNPHLNNIYLLDKSEKFKGLKALKKKIQAVHYNYILDIHNNLRSRYLTMGLKDTRVFRIHKDIRKRILLVKFKKNTYNPIKPIPIRYLETGSALQIADDGHGLEIFWKDDVDKKAASILRKLKIKSPFIVLAPGAGFKNKRWPIGHFKGLIKLIQGKKKYDFVVVGSKSEREDFKELEELPHVYNLAGELTLLEAAAIIRRAKMVVSNDSGMMHMAATVKTPVLAIFGPTVKEFGFTPYRSRFLLLENNSLSCRPCSHIGRDSCPKGHFKCMVDLKPEMALQLFNRLI